MALQRAQEARLCSFVLRYHHIYATNPVQSVVNKCGQRSVARR